MYCFIACIMIFMFTKYEYLIMVNMCLRLLLFGIVVCFEINMNCRIKIWILTQHDVYVIASEHDIPKSGTWIMENWRQKRWHHFEASRVDTHEVNYVTAYVFK